ncbi:MAG: response regulator [Legionellales bacterium]|jgi:CheY-like chemotaxis protein
MTKLILQPAAYYFPTTVLLVDDNQKYLMNLENILDTDAAIYKPFNNPLEVFEYIKKHSKHPTLPNSCIEREIDRVNFNHKIEIKIQPIQQEVFNSKRFEHISALVADHDMPEMKGLELFRKIKDLDLPIRKILLTGAATIQQALDAYNEGIIDQYITKDEDDFPARLNEAIKTQCDEQFKSDTSVIIKNIILKDQASCLNSEVYMTLLDSIIKKHNISEYYLIDDKGSYIFFDNDANSSWFIVKNQAILNADIARAEHSEVALPTEIMRQLKEHKLILTYRSEHDKEIPPKDWMPKGLLHSAKKFTSENQDYYYTYINKDVSTNTIDKNKIVSFYQYQDQLPG